MKKKEKTRRVLAFMLAVAMIFTTAFTNISASSGFGTPEGTEAAAGLFGDGSKGDASGAIDAGNLFGDGEAITGSESTKTVTLSGSVTYIAEDQTSHALTNILVRVYTADTEARTVAAEILSNEEGKFRIENLSAGSYTLEYIDKNENFDPAQFTLNQAAEDAGYTVKGVPADKEVEYFAAVENVSVQESREINLSLTQNAQITVDEENSGLVEMEVTEEPAETTEDKKEETTEETGDETASDPAEETGDETTSDAAEETGSEGNTEPPEDESEEGGKTETPEETTPETPAASKIIEVITDEVNLRTTPSVEEENIFAMVNTGAAFEVVEEVTAEDGLWYKVVYEGTEVYIRSDLVQVKETAETPSEETPEETPAEETEEEKQEESEENKEETSEETPAEEKMIELTADEVNIRTAPSAEAEIITVLPIGTRFVLLEEITAEDGTIWYKVRYEDGEAYVSGELAAVVAEDNEDTFLGEEDVEKISDGTIPVVTMNYEDDCVKVTVSAMEEGIIPEGSTLSVTPIVKDAEETAEQYAEVEQKLQEKAEGEEYDIAGFLAYDISFIDMEGNKVEPFGEVLVSMEYKEGAIPEEINSNNSDTTDVTVMHLEENQVGDIQQVVDMAESEQLTNIETTEANEVQKAEFVTDKFSVYTITWKTGWGLYKQIININYVGTDGIKVPESINGKEGSEEITFGHGKSKKIDLSSSEYSVNIDGYKNPTIHLDSVNGPEIQYIQYTYVSSEDWGKRYKFQSSSDGVTWEDWLGAKDDKNNNVYNIYIVYTADDPTPTPNPDPDPEPETPTLGVPEHNKRIGKNEDGTYTLALDVTGKQGSATPIDVLLIIDTSGSMSGTRASNVTNAVNTLKDNLKDVEVDVNIAAVTFSGPTTGQNSDSGTQNSNNGDAWETVSWTSIDMFNFSLDNCTGGTNWQAGVRKGEEVFSKRTSQNTKKYVIFLTDGNPTFRYGENSGITVGTGSSDRYNNNYNAAVTEWRNSPILSAATTVRYVIDATGTSSNMCDEFAEDIVATELAGNNGTSLNNSFQQIAQDIAKPSYTDVYIYDKLSVYAEFASNPNLTLYRVTKNEDGTETETEMSPSEYVYDINSTAKTVRIDLLNGNALEDGVTYRIKYNIVPSSYAYENYGTNNGYGDTKGDLDTDINLTNPTSSDKPGFYSNETAYVGYKENGGSPLEATYKHPVIQVDEESVPTPAPSDPVLGAPDHQKYIKYNTDDNYTLSLDVTGKLGKATPVDILLIVDLSGSMEDRVNGTARITLVKNAINELKNNLTEKAKDNEINIGLVTFSKHATDHGWKSLDQFSFDYGTKDCNGGTNWQAGVLAAKKSLAKRPENNVKYVIFLTDGQPTYYYDKNNLDNPTDNNVKGDGGTSFKSYCNSAISEWNTSGSSLLKIAKAFVIKADSSANYCTDFAKGISAGNVLDGTSSSNLTSSFKDIANKIAKPAYKDVVIQDTLSEYVDFLDENPVPTVVKIDKDGNETILSDNNPDQYDYDIDKDAKTVKVTLKPTADNKLEDGVTYRISFDIKPTDKAYYDYAKNGYNSVGDVGTDAPDNIPNTSSEQPGFRSNQKATVTYTVEGEKSAESEYDHPVVQVKKENVSKTVNKVWVGEVGESAEVVLKAEVDADGDGIYERELTHATYDSLPEDMTYTMTETDCTDVENSLEWSYTWDELPQYYYYENTQGVITKAETPIRYSVDEINIPDGYEKTTEISENGIFIITNTKTASLGVTKEWDTQGKTNITYESVKVGLFKEIVSEDTTQKEYELVDDSIEELSEANGWFYSYPIPYEDQAKYTIKEVMESTLEDGSISYIPVEDNGYIQIGDNVYQVSYSKGTDVETNISTVIIKNTLKLGSIQIDKVNQSGNKLAGAKFKLKKEDGSYVCDANGNPIVVTTDSDGYGIFENLEVGSYEIEEIEAPTGYTLFAGTIKVTIPYNEPAPDNPVDNRIHVIPNSGIGNQYYDVIVTIENVPLYELPQSGGPGIFWSLVGGVLLMMAAALIIYKNKCREVLRG